MGNLISLMTPEQFLYKISTNEQLPGIEAHQLMIPGKRALQRSEVENLHEYRDSAVAIVCYPIQNQVNCVLIQRPNYEGSHGGQISFPGGKKELSDGTLEQTARRETFEEIGWQLDSNNFICELTELFIPVSKFSVQPHLYFCEKPQLFVPNQREVDEILHFPVEILLNDAIIKHTDLQASSKIRLKNVPYFEINNRIVWGATAIILSELRAMLR